MIPKLSPGAARLRGAKDHGKGEGLIAEVDAKGAIFLNSLKGMGGLEGIEDCVGNSTVSCQMHCREERERSSLYKVSLFVHVKCAAQETLTIQGF